MKKSNMQCVISLWSFCHMERMRRIQTSRKWPPKMSSLSGRLRELRPYWVNILPHWHMVTAETYPVFKMFHSCERSISRKNPVLSIDKCPSLVILKNAMLEYLTIQFMLYYLSSGRLQEVKNKRKFPTFSSKSGRGRLREVVATRGSTVFLFSPWEFNCIVRKTLCSISKGAFKLYIIFINILIKR